MSPINCVNGSNCKGYWNTSTIKIESHSNVADMNGTFFFSEDYCQKTEVVKCISTCDKMGFRRNLEWIWSFPFSENNLMQWNKIIHCILFECGCNNVCSKPITMALLCVNRSTVSNNFQLMFWMFDWLSTNKHMHTHTQKSKWKTYYWFIS